MTAMLEQVGAEVAPSTNPAELLEVLAEDPDAFDVVITDFDMPSMTGADLARAVHALRPKLPVVLVTALPDWEARDMRRSTSPDFAAVLPKPASSATLVTRLRAIMASR